MHSFSVALLVGTAKNKQWNQSLPCFNFYELLNVLSSHWFQSSGGNWGHSGIAGKLGLYTMYMLIAVSPLPCNFFTNQSFQSTSNLLLSQMPSACWYGFFLELTPAFVLQVEWVDTGKMGKSWTKESLLGMHPFLMKWVHFSIFTDWATFGWGSSLDEVV